VSLGETDTRAKLIDPAIHARGWTEDLIRREETAASPDERRSSAEFPLLSTPMDFENRETRC
jgi:type I site-specific restriction endonuclease